MNVGRHSDVAAGNLIHQEWFGQPRGMTVLFLSEMWEQFSFHGMRTLLVYYMTQELLISQVNSSLIYGSYAAAFFMTPLFGGMIADRFIGKKNAVIFGALLMSLGHFMMTFESLFFPALAAIAVGNGFFLPSLSSQINLLYSSRDPRLASAYNTYYVGINVGSFMAPFVCGTLGQAFGWHWGFAAAGVGMLIGLATYLAGMKYLPEDRLRSRADRAPRGGSRAQVVRRFLLLFGIMATVIIFRGAYEQDGNTIALFTYVGIDRHLGAGWSVPLTWFQALNPLFIFTMTPFLVRIWTRMAQRGREPSSVKKMVIGAAVVALAYGILAIVSGAAAAGHARSSWLWLLLFFVVETLGEIFILPVGLGLFGRLAPKGYAATAIGTWLFAGFAGNLLAGGLGMFWSRLSQSMFFALIAATAALSAVALLFFVRAGARAEQQLRDEPDVEADQSVASIPAGAKPTALAS